MHDILDTNGLFHGFNAYILYSVNLLFFFEWMTGAFSWNETAFITKDQNDRLYGIQDRENVHELKAKFL